MRSRVIRSNNPETPIYAVNTAPLNTKTASIDINVDNHSPADNSPI